MTTITDLFKSSPNTALFRKGDVIFDRGDYGDTMYVIREGEVAIAFNGVIVETLQAGDFFGEVAVIQPQVRAVTAIAKTDALIVPISQQRFERLLDQMPRFALNVMKTINERANHARPTRKAS